MDERTVRVAAQEGGERIDKYLAAYGEPFVSRNFVQSLIADGRVRVNGSVVNRPSFRLSAGDVIEVVLPLPPSPVPEPEAIPLDIVYDDGSVIVVNQLRAWWSIRRRQYRRHARECVARPLRVARSRK